jgi:hypothetical protein
MNKKGKFLEYLEESLVKFAAHSEHFSTFGVKGLRTRYFAPDSILFWYFGGGGE